MEKQESQVKLTFKYDDGRETISLWVDKVEMDKFLEREYCERVKNTPADQRNAIKKLTPEEYVETLNRDSYNNWHKHNRHTCNNINRLYHVDSRINETIINSIPDASAEKEYDHLDDIDYISQKLYTSLPKKQADLLWDLLINDMTVQDIALRDGVTSRAVYLRLETAKKNFKNIFPNPSLF